jgi:hypothetical protein
MEYKESEEISNREIELCFNSACNIISGYSYKNFDHMRDAISELTVGLYVDIKSLKSQLIGYKGKIPVPKVKEDVIKKIDKYNQERLFT